MSGRGGGGVDGSSTYEQAMASSRESALPDRVRWDRDSSFRDQPYRFLHHQGGIVGHVSVRLIEARNLRRPNDDGGGGGGGGNDDERDKISSYAVLHLSSGDGDDDDSADGPAVAGSSDGGGGGGKKRAASDRIIEERMDLSSSSHSHSSLSSTTRSEAFRSSVVPHTNDPTWTSTRAGDSSFSIPLRKNFVCPDGAAVYVNVEMNERDTGGKKLLFAGRDRPLGSAAINVSPVLFGEEGVMDVWLDLREPDHYHRHSAPYAVAASAAAAADHHVDKTHADAVTKERRRRSCGRVRLLVAYEPRGMQPREGDVVCLEAFARSPTNLIFNPLAQPMRVLATRGDYLLVRYGTASYSRPGRSTRGGSAVEKPTGQVRLHRNAVFVIERFTLVDGVVDLALKPADVLGSIPAVRWAGEAVGPYAGVVGDLAMPAVLSAKLVMAAARTAGTAGITGVATTGKVLLMAVAAGKRDKSQEQLDRERAEEESRQQYQRGGGW